VLGDHDVLAVGRHRSARPIETAIQQSAAINQSKLMVHVRVQISVVSYGDALLPGREAMRS